MFDESDTANTIIWACTKTEAIISVVCSQNFIAIRMKEVPETLIIIFSSDGSNRGNCYLFPCNMLMHRIEDVLKEYSWKYQYSIKRNFERN